MSRIAARFNRLRGDYRTALIPYITAGDPLPEFSVPLMHAMVETGADIIELGVPFSDPMADGPVIQAACERALEHHVSLRQVLRMVRSFRERDQNTPVVLMGYLNPIEVMGYAEFALDAADAGVDGVLTVDLPPEEAGGLLRELARVGIDPIFLIAPTTNPIRMKSICEASSGFVYYVALKGVTGASTLDVSSVQRKLAEIRNHADVPIGVGFGIKDADSAATIGKIADAVVVGSALVKRIEANVDQPEMIKEAVCSLLRSMRSALDTRVGSGELKGQGIAT
ncbi:MAG: tryptophan synthase subunit alpha [Gammaproteobacteria bacterium]|nr:tryptophan synthase subunit alpha [Gammaproteobacteria bacterium]